MERSAYFKRVVVKFGMAVMLLASVCIGYWPAPSYIIEMTCISNSLLGLIFLVSGVRVWQGKKEFPNWVYSTGTVTVLLVFLICMGSLTGTYHMNFEGAFLFLHVINLLAVLLYYLFFLDEKRNGKKKWIFFTPLFALAYLLVDYVAGTIAGKFVYGFFEPGELSVLMAFAVGAVIYLFLLAVGFAIFGGNLLFRKKFSVG